MTLVPWYPPWAEQGSSGSATDARLDALEERVPPDGLTGALQATRFAGATASGAPTSGTFEAGDFVVDQSGAVFICTAPGSPGTWADMSSGKQLAYVESTLQQTGIGTALTDITNLTVTFTVGARPVDVEAVLPYVQISAAMTVIATIRDENNVDKAHTAAGGTAASQFVGGLRVIEQISTPGTYTRKLSVQRFGGSGTITVGVGGATPYRQRISAVTR